MKIFVSYLVMVTMFLNLSAPAFFAAFTGASLLYSTSSYAQSSDTPLLDELSAKHNLGNSQRNHQTDEIPTNIQDQIDNPGLSRDMNPQIQKVLSTPVVIRDLQLDTKYPVTATFDDYKDAAVNTSKTHGQPTGTIVGNKLQSMDVEYTRSGTRQFVRDPATGKLVLQVIQNVDRASGLSDNQLFSQEIVSPSYGYENNKESLYGDNVAIYAEGKTTNDTFKNTATGTSASARGYRAITEGATKANNTSIDEAALWLQPSFGALNDAQDPSQWLSACAETTTTSSDTYSYGATTEHRCQDTGQSQFDFCEVERKIVIPAYSNTPGLRSCGLGCYEFDLVVSAPKKSSCSTTYGASPKASAATFNMFLNLQNGVEIQSVFLKGEADDHVKVSLNGQALWESDGNIEAGSCENNGNPDVNQAFTAQANSILGPVSGQVELNFRGDIRWKSKGWLNVNVKIQLKDTLGTGFESTFTQYPEGCYDALSEEDKLTRGLYGMYGWNEIGVDQSSPPTYFQCESPARTPTCDIGEVLFGNPGQEMCYSNTQLAPSCSIGTLNTDKTGCEYDATLSCPPASGNICGAFTSVNEVGTVSAGNCTYTDVATCGATWSRTEPAAQSCPDGGVPNNGICELPVEMVPACLDPSDTLTNVMMNGVLVERCESAPTGYTSNVWSCLPSSQSYSAGNCSITRESYIDEYGQPIKTLDASGNPLPSPVDSEGQPINFTDIANCMISGSGPIIVDPEVPVSFCTFDDYQPLIDDDGGYPQSILDVIPPFYTGDLGNRTWRVNLDGYRCDPTNGQIMCYPDPDTGEDICRTWEEIQNLPDRCAPYTADPTCQEISRDCTEGWTEEITGRCMAETVIYACTDETVIDYETTNTTSVCDAMLGCTGGECEIGSPEANEKFVQAMVAGSVLDNVQGDSSCTDPTDPGTCTIFNGEYEYCSWEVTGLGTDCCEAAQGVDILAYVVMARQMLKVNQMVYSGAFGQGISGSYQQLAEPVTSAYKAVSNWASKEITSVTNTIFGNADSVAAGTSGITEGFAAALGQVQQQAYQLVYDLAPDALTDFLFGESAKAYVEDQTADLVMDEALGNMMSNVMAIYTAYQMVKLALTLLTACDDNEVDMGVKLGQRQCFSVGNRYCSKEVLGVCYQRRQSYCCYSSILSRIIMKESYDQLGIDPLPYGNKPNMTNGESDASCRGLSPEELSMVDFDRPSMQTALQEWIGLLLDAGELPNETDEQYLTGGATVQDKTNCPMQQTPVLTCYVDPNTLDEICNQTRDAAGNLVYQNVPTDCGGELTGGGQIWNAEDRVVASERITGPGGYIGTADERVQETKDMMRTLPGNLDCSVSPRPPACDFGFDPVDP